MNVAVIIILLAIVGAGMGSFACCQAWRIRKSDKSRRSHCMNCNYKLKWFDNIPVISWVFLGGKCRKCHKKIGVAEIISEVLLAAAFALSYVFWPWRAELDSGNVLAIIRFVLFLIQLVMFMLVAVYDAKWKEMPTAILIASCVIGVAFLCCGGLMLDQLPSLAGALLILPGFYYLMYKASKEKWVGGGDPILCVALAIMLGDFWLSMFTLFAANVIGSVVMLPVSIVKRDRRMQIPFGPFLILGFLVVFFCRSFFLNLVSI